MDDCVEGGVREIKYKNNGQSVAGNDQSTYSFLVHPFVTKFWKLVLLMLLALAGG